MPNLVFEMPNFFSKCQILKIPKLKLRRSDLEGTDSNLIIIDIEGSLNTRLINVYRAFAPQNGVSQRDKFKYQLSLINTAMCNVNSIQWGSE